MAQPGSAPQWGCGGRRFKSCRSDDEKNELVKMAIKQVEEIAKKVAKNIQSDVDKTTRATINNLIMGFNEHIDSFKFNEKNISDEQVHIEILVC